MAYKKLVGTRNRHESWVTEVILEKDDDGNPTKVVRQGEPIDLSKADLDKLEGMGLVFEKSSAEEAKEFAERGGSGAVVGGDVAAAAPLFGDSSGEPNQSTDQPDEG